MTESAATPLILTRETAPLRETVSALGDGLDGHNAAFFPAADWTPRYFIGRDAAGTVRSGVRYFIAYDWMFINWLWVAAPYRRSGEGSRLMDGAEAEARALGCRGAYLDTFSFQAPKFYEKRGYLEFGRLSDFPPGFVRHWFMKPLS